MVSSYGEWHLNGALKDKVQDLIYQGLAQHQIASKLGIGCSSQVVGRAIKEWGLETRRERNKRLKREEKEEAKHGVSNR